MVWVTIEVFGVTSKCGSGKGPEITGKVSNNKGGSWFWRSLQQMDIDHLAVLFNSYSKLMQNALGCLGSSCNGFLFNSSSKLMEPAKNIPDSIVHRSECGQVWSETVGHSFCSSLGFPSLYRHHSTLGVFSQGYVSVSLKYSDITGAP